MATGDKRPSRGGDMLARSADSHAEIAAKIGVDKSLVTRWISGARRPTDAQLPRLTELYGIPSEAWKTPAAAKKKSSGSPKKTSVSPVSPVPKVPAPEAEHGPDRDDAVPDADRLRRFIRDGMRELETSELPANKRAEALKKLVDAKVALDRSTGENALTLQRIVVHPEFIRVVRLITDAIAPYPDALQAAIAALEASRGGG